MAVFQKATFQIPRAEYLQKWPVIACDQFTSQPEYWRETAKLVGDAPSAYHIIFPEAELGTHEAERIASINRTMKDYLAAGVFQSYPDCYVYVERTLRDGSIRRGLVGVVDLEGYEFHDAAKTPIRATEKTVVSRIPPRVRIRSGAVIESSHILLLCSDPQDMLLGAVDKGEPLYDLELMQGGGRLCGWIVRGDAAKRFDASLAAYEATALDGFAYAVGDGNHSLATAKACWEQLKEEHPELRGSDHPARYAMVELENIFDGSQRFEAIHRVVRAVDPEKLLRRLQENCAAEGIPVSWFTRKASGVMLFPAGALPIAALQSFLDSYLEENGGEIDYIHGSEVAVRLAKEENAIAFVLPAIEKNALFPTIIRSGVLPRKTFSMGHAEEKRYYLECRRIK